MKRFFALFLVVLVSFYAFSFEYKGDNFKVIIATSIPVETDLSYGKTAKAYEVWINAIKTANKSIDFSEFYLTGKDRWPLSLVVKEIVNAANRGVKVRFLVDVKMLKNSKELVEYFSKIPNIKVTIFNWKHLTGGINHSKYFIVDNKLCFVGSQNFDWRALKHIHETGILTDEPHIVKALSLIFNADWDYNNGDRKAYEKLRKQKVTFRDDIYLTGSPDRLLPDGMDFSLNELLNMINSAKKSITIQLLNYSTFVHGKTEKFDAISKALIKAANRGVNVKLLVSNWNLRKPGVDSLKELARVKNIEVRFVQIPVSKKEGFIPYARVIHSKVVIVDNKVGWVSTSNFGYDYFYKSRNVEVVLKIKPVLNVLREMFKNLWNSKYAHKLNLKRDYKPPKIT
ncbi:phospholipase D3/4 [Thermotomaculum hydrothermale]|uniref:Phospholipase D3/4 n=1 Tax=Thermotomaculum hydrothermale TaxID=981385 RepID=A0A7R6PYA0_9BACT|nr:phospholipase D-like domain-containing protein [Thermotomaculum hydrothermale]BBB31828.1 phospholipase D3/4 [Thermotomaculum hydrothermale]